MTCIIAIKDDDQIVMAGDRGCDYGYMMDVDTVPKIVSFERGNLSILVGYAGTSKGLGLLREAFIPPEWDGESSVRGYMTVDFMDALRECWNDHYFDIIDDESQCSMIIATCDTNGELDLFNADNLLDITSSEYSYMSVGSGASFALGLLAGTELSKLDSKTRVQLAMRSADKFDKYVQAPFDIVTMDKDRNIVFSG